MFEYWILNHQLCSSVIKVVQQQILPLAGALVYWKLFWLFCAHLCDALDEIIIIYFVSFVCFPATVIQTQTLLSRTLCTRVDTQPLRRIRTRWPTPRHSRWRRSHADDVTGATYRNLTSATDIASFYLYLWMLCIIITSFYKMNNVCTVLPRLRLYISIQYLLMCVCARAWVRERQKERRCCMWGLMFINVNLAKIPERLGRRKIIVRKHHLLHD